MMKFGTHGVHRAVALYILPVVLAAYCIVYYFSRERPRTGAVYPLGWYGWADQGEYFRSIAAFGRGDLSAAWHHYPPLYDLIATPFSWLLPQHPHFIPDAILFVFYCYALVRICRRFYGVLTAPIVLVVLMIGAPVFTIQQWVIPWTTSLQAALASALFLIYFSFERARHPFVLQGRHDYFLFCVFFLAYGALLPTRPLDIVVFLPFAFTFFLRVTIATARTRPVGQAWLAAATCLLLAALSGAVFVAFYLGFNAVVFNSMFGRYADAIGQFRYDIFTLPQKAYSIFWHSGAVYAETGQAFFEKMPLLGLALALCIVTAFICGGIRRWLIICAFLQFAAYLPYGDLLPTGVFRYYNLHYFKWTYPWLFVIAVGQLVVWSRDFRRSGWKPLVASVGIVLVGANLSLVPTQVETVRELRAPTESQMSIEFARERELQYVDIPSVRGEFPSLYFGNHTAVIDGTRAFNKREFRILPTAGGVRLLFSRPERLTKIVLKLDSGVLVTGTEGTSVAAGVRFAFACRFHDCEEPRGGVR